MTSASQLVRFRDEIAVGDRAITYDASQRIYHVGTITGPCRHSPTEIPTLANVRSVSWEGGIDRDRLSTVAKNSLGAIQTLFKIPAATSDELERLLRGDFVQHHPQPEEQASEQVLLERYRNEAFEIIEDRVNRLSWDDMQELVAGLLRAMGYKTRVSSPGPDRGIDIMASPDGFGFESPRIIVEVKHRNQAIGAPDIRSFAGGRHKDDKGLYVSTGGFTKDARLEADRADVPMMLMDIGTLVKAIFRNCDAMDADAHKLLPLKKIYWPL